MNHLLRRGSWAITLAIALGSVLFLSLVFFPRMRRIGELRDQVRLKQDYIAQSERMRPVIARLNEDVAKTQEYSDRWRARCTKVEDLSALFGEISRLSAEAGVSTDRFEPQPPVEYQTLRKAPVQIGVGGTFASVETLLAKLEALPALVWIEELKLSRSSEAGQSVKAELVLAVFVDGIKKSD